MDKIRVIIAEAYNNDEYAFALLEAGVACYLLKDMPLYVRVLNKLIL